MMQCMGEWLYGLDVTSTRFGFYSYSFFYRYVASNEAMILFNPVRGDIMVAKYIK